MEFVLEKPQYRLLQLMELKGNGFKVKFFPLHFYSKAEEAMVYSITTF